MQHIWQQHVYYNIATCIQQHLSSTILSFIHYIWQQHVVLQHSNMYTATFKLNYIIIYTLHLAATCVYSNMCTALQHLELYVYNIHLSSDTINKHEVCGFAEKQNNVKLHV